jgi:hypothetical protein
MNRARRSFLVATGSTLLGLSGAGVGSAQQPGDGRLQEPLYRVSNNALPTVANHPLDEALAIAQQGLDHIQANVLDYTATLIKRERVDDELGDYEYMFCKVRNRKIQDGQIAIPFSVYLGFLKPQAVRGREVVYVEGRNHGKMTAHEGGTKGRFLPTVSLDPQGTFAMRGQRYPLTELGVENLVAKLIERGNRDRQHPDVTVDIRRNTRVGQRVCTMIQVQHPEPRADFDFSVARVFIDDELNLPVRYAAYDWPREGQTNEHGMGDVIEEYTYLNLQVNVGLTDRDFDPENPEYNF